MFKEVFLSSFIIIILVMALFYKYSKSFSDHWNIYYLFFSALLMGNALGCSLFDPGNQEYYYYVYPSIYFLLVAMHIENSKRQQLTYSVPVYEPEQIPIDDNPDKSNVIEEIIK